MAENEILTPEIREQIQKLIDINKKRNAQIKLLMKAYYQTLGFINEEEGLGESNLMLKLPIIMSKVQDNPKMFEVYSSPEFLAIANEFPENEVLT